MRRLGSGLITDRAVKFTLFPCKFWRNRPCFPFSRWTKDCRGGCLGRCSEGKALTVTFEMKKKDQGFGFFYKILKLNLSLSWELIIKACWAWMTSQHHPTLPWTPEISFPFSMPFSIVLFSWIICIREVVRSSSFVPWRTSEAIEGRMTEGETFQNLKNFGSLKNVSKCTCSLVINLLPKKLKKYLKNYSWYGSENQIWSIIWFNWHAE